MTDLAVPARRPLGVGVAGMGWMGRVHTMAYTRVLHHFPELPVAPRLVAVADEVLGRPEEAAARFGFTTPTNDWREIAANPEVAVVSIAAPNFLHREIGVAMAQAGKHIWIEKPVGLTSEDARAVADAVAAAGVQGAVGFNYRNAPAVEAAKAMVETGELGTITHARFRFFSDYAAHPDGALTWRYERGRGGSGVLGDLAAHTADLTYYVLGDLESLVADTAIFIPRRPKASGATAGHVRATGGETGPVENEDYVGALARTTAGARVVLEASRIAVGDQNAYGFEVHGTKGSLAWDFRRMNELAVGSDGLYQDQPMSTLYVGPAHGDFGAFQPGAANAMGMDDLKVIEAARFLRSVAEGTPYGSTLADAVRSATLLDAMAESAAKRAWVSLA
ncbi:Gfo/Idh/MocA family protein [Pseudonocardia pini]|uniref:Gfo/Idh/MocA family protein n=1 Tax=Pseudonocardia pini TaxID=2758030 RepID=UPI0015F0522D|nr:Gfo/Idh/MocA family oxidoreductase [Pseudonocardia pini]